MAEEGNTQEQRNRTKQRRLPPRSEVWNYFTRATGDDGKEIARCNRCGKEYAYHGTKNLWEHLEECSGQEPAAAAAACAAPPPQPRQPKHVELYHGVVSPSKRPRQRSPPCPPLSRSGGGSSSERELGLEEDEEASRDLARMIALNGYYPSIVEDDHFRSFVHRLNPGFKVPSRCDIETICDGILEVQERLDKQFERIQEELRMVYENRSKSSSDKVQEMGPEKQLPPVLPLPCAPSRPRGLLWDLHEFFEQLH